MSSGVVHLIARDDEDAAQLCRRLLSFMPSNNLEDPPRRPCTDPIDRADPKLDSLIPDLIEAGFDIVQLEKVTPAGVAEVVKFARDSRSGAVIAAAGGIGPSNAREYAEAGAGLIVSSWPYTARPSDVKVTIGPA